jgi:alkylated DNA nucleotide flippase Atl1
MPRERKTWVQKLAAAKAKPGLPKTFFCDKAGKTFVVPSPAEVEAVMRSVRRGRVITFAEIGRRLREAHQVEEACPMTTGIFAWLIAHAAGEAAAAGLKKIPPWWRVLKTGGLLNPRFPGGGLTQKALLEAEGHKVVQKGKAWIVAAS